jgi:bifunctional DNA-binding transcriptional regulator/antitoxin component of YhaV-PrlF toxin-antitoxin module
MHKHVIKVEKTTGSMRIVIPRDIVKRLFWHHVGYVLIEDDAQGRIIIRRLLDDEALETSNKKNTD